MRKFMTGGHTPRRPMAWAVSLTVACAVASLSPALAADEAAFPNFAPDSRTGWLKPAGDEFIQPDSGPGPVKSDPAHPYVPNTFPFVSRDKRPQETIMIADLTNPILQPWVIERMRKSNEEVLAGKVGFTARSRCWPHGVPGFLLYPVHPIIFVQTPKFVVMTWGQDFEVRHVYLNVPHSADPKPSWYGESVGHYEGGDTLVIDTIGISDRTFVDNYRTPHTSKLHVVERLKLVEGGKVVQISMTVDDPGAFTMPWSATQRWRRVTRGPITEGPCNENNTDHFNHSLIPTPMADKPDF